MDAQQPDLTIVAPMFNESANVARTVGLVKGALDGYDGTWEFVIVNDGSTDDSWDIAREHERDDPRIRAVGYSVNRGRGSALRHGFAAARGRHVVTIDFDLSYSADHVLAIDRHLRENPDVDVVLGSAYMPGGGTEGVDPKRLWVSKVGNRILSASLDGRFHTITCVLRGYRREVVQGLALDSDGKDIHLEILAKCLAMGHRVEEIPAVLRARKRGKSKMRIGGTAMSHMAFALSMRPMYFFGVAGLVSLVLGVIAATVAIVLSARGAPTSAGIAWSVVTLMILGGLQAFGIGFLSLQIGALRQDVHRVQCRQVAESRAKST